MADTALGAHSLRQSAFGFIVSHVGYMAETA